MTTFYYDEKEQAKEYLKGFLPDYLTSKGINIRANFRCLSPTHEDKHPSMGLMKDKRNCHCFSGDCGVTYDIFQIIGIDCGLSDFKDQFNRACELYGVEMVPRPKEENRNTDKSTTKRTIDPPPRADQPEPLCIEPLPDEPTTDFTGIVEAAHNELLKNQKALSYLQGRGISLETIKAYKFGYDAAGYNHFLKDFPQHQSKSKKAGLYRYIFPYPNHEGRFTYFLSEIEDRTQIDDYNGKYRKVSRNESEISAQIFNERYIKTGEPIIFVCEGIYDALSVEEAGGKAIAFTGTADKRFLSLCKRYDPETTFVISLDNDEAGKKAMERVKEGLNLLQIPYIVKTAEKGKDFNEELTTNRAAFTKYIQQTVNEIERMQNEHKYKAADLLDYFRDIENRQPGFEVKTGFDNLDSELSGGLHEGLIVIGAISSLGKTTFTLQLADQIAAAGQDVLFFSLEMSKYELMAKSISRYTYSRVRDKKTADGAHFLARDTMQILNNRKYQYYAQEERDVITQAIKDYEAPAAHVFIYEGRYKGERLTVQHIREIVKNHVETTKRKPVVIVDYLQIIAPEDVRGTDKQNTDIAVFELKEISRDFTIPVIAISSFNRENYMQPVSMASFKESGAVEYSSDVLFGLQYTGMDLLPGEKSEKDAKRNERIREIIQGNQIKKRQKQPIEIELKCLKNRNGYTFTVPLYMVAAFNHFEEVNGFRPVPDGTETPFEKSNPFEKYKK